MLFFILAAVQVVSLLGDELVAVQVMFRHGAREQVYDNLDWQQYKQKRGQLTDVGIRQQYALGARLRERYSHLIQGRDVYVRSSDVTRTQQSAHSALLGLYDLGTSHVDHPHEHHLLPPIEGAKHPEKVNVKEALPKRKVPVKIDVKKAQHDRVLRSHDHMCPRIANNHKTHLYKTVEEYTKQISQSLGPKYQHLNFWQLHCLQDTLKAYLYKNISLPEEITEQAWERLQHVSALAFSLRFYQTWEYITNCDNSQVKVQSTPFYQEIVKNMENVINGTTKTRLFLYSGHDTNVMLFLQALNITSTECLLDQLFQRKEPQCQVTKVDDDLLAQYAGYSASLIYELWRNDEQLYVQVLYNGVPMDICSAQTTQCPYSEFKTLIRDQEASFDKYCGLEKTEL